LKHILFMVASVMSVGLLHGGIISSGTITIPGTFLFDVDLGVIATGGYDFQWDFVTETQFQVSPVDFAGVVNMGVVPFAAITVGQLEVLPYNTVNGIDFSLLVPSDVFAVESNSGNFAKVLITGPPDLNLGLPIQWETDSTSAIPEPATIGLVGLAGLAFLSRRLFVSQRDHRVNSGSPSCRHKTGEQRHQSQKRRRRS
jgi:PEP-CTERM motif